ncbi:MAG TPA: ABC-2 family transporter protein [Gemmatimonadaceae bacterium]|nr:ABC-2 family transporter protein [Gemmatimonadaceae bacterium]
MREERGERGKEELPVSERIAPLKGGSLSPFSFLLSRLSWFHRYAALIRAGWLVDFQYRASIAIWLLWSLVEPAISLGIWWAIAGHGSVQGFSRSDFARYFFGVMLVNQLTSAWDAYYLDRWIREGEMNFRLVRPIAPIHEAVADNIAYKLRTGVVVLVIWLLTAAVWPAVRIPLEPARWALAALAIVFAAGIRFLSGYATGLLAFWTTRATALMELQFGVSLFLSGRIAPLALLPAAAGAVASVLWFPSMLAFPVEVLTGAVPLSGAYGRGLAMQIVWLVIWWGAYRFVWSRGMRRYGAVGG